MSGARPTRAVALIGIGIAVSLIVSSYAIVRVSHQAEELRAQTTRNAHALAAECALLADYKRKNAKGYRDLAKAKAQYAALLEKNPDGIGGIPAPLIRQSYKDERASHLETIHNRKLTIDVLEPEIGAYCP